MGKNDNKEVKQDLEQELVIETITKEKRKELNIFEKMSMATDRIVKVAKNLKVNINANASYKAVSEADVLEAVKPVEVELGIYSYPVDRIIIDTAILDTEKEYKGTITRSNQLFMRVETVYRFVNVDKTEEYVDIKTYGDGVDSGDKAPGKAMTYSDKYALLKAYKIETGEDPDKEASGNLKGVNKMNSDKDKLQQERQNKEISPKQLETIVKWSNNGEHTDKILEELKLDIKREVKSFEELTMVEASAYISKKIKEMEERKANGGNE